MPERSGLASVMVRVYRALARPPRVLLMDEPLSNLDAQLRTQLRAESLDLRRRVAMTMGSRIAVMEGGPLQQVDTPQAVYDDPANTFVARISGSPSMNLLHRDWRSPVRRFVAPGASLALVDRPSASCPLILGLRPEYPRLAEPTEHAALIGTSTGSNRWAAMCWRACASGPSG